MSVVNESTRQFHLTLTLLSSISIARLTHRVNR